MEATVHNAFKKLMLFSLILLVFLSFGNGQNACASGTVVDDNHTMCQSCHRIPPQEISETNLFPEGIDPSSICLDCHHDSDNHHPVNFIPESTFPNSGGKTFFFLMGRSGV